MGILKIILMDDNKMINNNPLSENTDINKQVEAFNNVNENINNDFINNGNDVNNNEIINSLKNCSDMNNCDITNNNQNENELINIKCEE